MLLQMQRPEWSCIKMISHSFSLKTNQLWKEKIKSEKTNEIWTKKSNLKRKNLKKKIWKRGGGSGPPGPPLDPPVLTFAGAFSSNLAICPKKCNLLYATILDHWVLFVILYSCSLLTQFPYPVFWKYLFCYPLLTVPTININ